MQHNRRKILPREKVIDPDVKVLIKLIIMLTVLALITLLHQPLMAHQNAPENHKRVQ